MCGEGAEGAEAAAAGNEAANEAEAAEAAEALAAAAEGQHRPLLRLLTAREAAARPSGALQEEGERAVAEAEARRWRLSSGAALEAAAEEEAEAAGAEEGAEGAEGAEGVAAAVAVRAALLLGAARREPGAALALTLDRPCGARLRGAARGVERRLREAAAEDDVAAAEEMCALGVRCYGALLCCYGAGATPRAARRALGAPTEAALLALVPPATAKEEGDGGGVAAARERLEALLRVRVHLGVAARLAPLLPALRVTRFACDAGARAEATFALACAPGDAALEAAFGLAEEVGVEVWEVRMARLTHLLSQPERLAANASLAASVEAREATRAAVAHHQPQLLLQPARLSRALACQAWPAAPASAARLQLLLELLLDSERRQRQQRKESAAAAAAAGTAPAASSPPPPAGLLDHNATLLLALRAAVRYLGLVSIAPAP